MVIDASVWVSAFWANDPNHTISITWLRKVLQTSPQLWEPRLLLVEIASAVARRTDDPALARQAVDSLRGLKQIEWVALDDTVLAEATQVAISLRLRAADTVYVAVAERNRVALATWDNEQISRAQSVVQTISPGGA